MGATVVGGEGLDGVLHYLAERKRSHPRLAIVERQARILHLIESRGRQPIRSREFYRYVHLKREEFEDALHPLLQAGLLRREGEMVVPSYNDLDPPLDHLRSRIRRLEGPAGPLVAAPLRALALLLLVGGSSLGAAVLLEPILFPPEPPLEGAALLAGDCAGFGLRLGEGRFELQLERGGELLAQGSADSADSLFICKRGGGLSVSSRIPPEGAALLPISSPRFGDYLLVNLTVRGRGTLTDVLISDFREDNRLGLSPEWATPFGPGYLVGARNRGEPLEGTLHLYRLSPNGSLSPAGRPTPLSLPAGEKVAFSVSPGTTYAVLKTPGGDGHLRLEITEPFGSPEIPGAVRVG